MRLSDITATGHTDGNRVDLTWSYPAGVSEAGVRVVRRERTHPANPDDGTVVDEGIGLVRATDTGLLGEHVYYYGLFPYTGHPPVYDPDPHNVATATAVTPYGFGERLYGLLPAIHRRYDADLPPARQDPTASPDTAPGQLRAFLGLPGAELDRLYSLGRAALSLTDLERVDGRLLPLLAQWIGWHTDHALPIAAQRNEIRFAPRLYRTTGSVRALDATVARVTGWSNRTKEFVHNVARSNRPERLNLWSALRDTTGRWSEPALASVDFAHDGRPTAVEEADGSTLVFYHTRRRHGWDIWSKRYTDTGWQPSLPVTDGPTVDKHPSAARQGDRLWLFWQTCDPGQAPGEQRRQIVLTTRTGTRWSAPAVFGDPSAERRAPTAVADGTGGLWLFWLERVCGIWQLRHNRHDGTAWQLTTPAAFPLDGGQDPRVEDDLCAVLHPTAAAGRLWLFWARREPAGPAGQSRWSIAYRVKQGLDPAASDWSPVRPLPRSGAHHDRQPAPLVAPDGTVEVYWSSTRAGGWSIQRAGLTPTTLAWGSPEQVVGDPSASRGPLAVHTGPNTLLVYRSNASLPHTDEESGTVRTLDHRYAGTTTADTRDTAKRLLRGTFEDFQTYTYDTGSGGTRSADDRISRDTVGLFLTPDTTDPARIAEVSGRLAGTLADVTPVSTRPVLITPPTSGPGRTSREGDRRG
ncbi:phage tail protein [Streptomyces griseorubiginosus]|uniref:phage tail protein n=1 Tax=Streptomyces griseorubiginosus TaxID=67304 RepID=UPI0011403E33|nr:phage tail protein [Streptomyces griseorubiginosus]